MHLRSRVVKLTERQKQEILTKYQTKLFSGRQLSIDYGVNDSTISKLLIKNKIPVDHSRANRRYTINENYFDTIDTEQKAYFLGLLYADGCNYVPRGEIRINLQERDKDILEKFSAAIGSNKPLHFISRSIKNIKWQNQMAVNISSKHMSNQLVSLGCVQAKSLVIKFPSEEQVPTSLVKHFIRGMWDGDGSLIYSCYNRKNRPSKHTSCTATLTSTLDICNSVKNIIKNTLDINSSVYHPKGSSSDKIASMGIGGNQQFLKLVDWLYKDATVFLDRKYNKYLELKNFINAIHHKLNKEIILEIVDLRKAGFTLDNISKKFGVGKEAVRNIMNGKTWSSVTGITYIKNSHIKLEEKQIIEIRKLLCDGELTQKEISIKYNISKSTVGMIKSNKIWSKVK